jgi:hypothetical protein
VYLSSLLIVELVLLEDEQSDALRTLLYSSFTARLRSIGSAVRKTVTE